MPATCSANKDRSPARAARGPQPRETKWKNTATAVKNKIEVKNLNFYYGKFHAIRNVNMSIQEKKVTAFIGPSGCGKSTLLRTFNRMFELYPGQRAEGEIILTARTCSPPRPISR